MQMLGLEVTTVESSGGVEAHSNTQPEFGAESTAGGLPFAKLRELIESCGGRARAEVYVSHSWDNLFLDTVDALERYLYDHNMPLETVVWIDLFRFPQAPTINHLAPLLLAETITAAISEIKKVVVVMEPVTSPPKPSVWNVFELLIVQKTDSKLEIALTPMEADKFNAQATKDAQATFEKFGQINCKTAIDSAHSIAKTHKDAVLEAIRNSSFDFGDLDGLLFDALVEWGTAYARAQLKFGPDASSIPDKTRMEWAATLGDWYRFQELTELADGSYGIALLVAQKIHGTKESRDFITIMIKSVGMNAKEDPIASLKPTHLISELIKALKLPPSDPLEFQFLMLLATIYRYVFEVKQTEFLREAVLQSSAKAIQWGLDHTVNTGQVFSPESVTAMYSTALSYRAMFLFDEAQKPEAPVTWTPERKYATRLFTLLYRQLWAATSKYPNIASASNRMKLECLNHLHSLKFVEKKSSIENDEEVSEDYLLGAFYHSYTILGPTHPTTVHARSNVVEYYRITKKEWKIAEFEAETDTDSKSVVEETNPESQMLLLNNLLDLSSKLLKQGDLQGAYAKYLEYVNLGDPNGDALESLGVKFMLAVEFQKQGIHDIAEKLFRLASKVIKKYPNHVEPIVARTCLRASCDLLRQLNKPQLAADQFIASAEYEQAQESKCDLDILTTSFWNAGELYFEAGLLQQAESAYSQQLEWMQDPRVKRPFTNEQLIQRLETWGKRCKSEKFLHRWVQLVDQVHGRNSLEAILCRYTVGETVGRFGEVDPETGFALPYSKSVETAWVYWKEAITISTSLFGSQDPQTMETKRGISYSLKAAGRFDLAEPYYVELLDFHVREYGWRDDRTFMRAVGLAELYDKWDGHGNQAVELYLKALATQRETKRLGHSQVAFVNGLLAKCLVNQKRWEEAKIPCVYAYILELWDAARGARRFDRSIEDDLELVLRELRKKNGLTNADPAVEHVAVRNELDQLFHERSKDFAA
ncbi:hypothetical protein BDR26DRAFT_873331 [Obelidium mucronatum]|nr:hypothetical protein BDR26DRAFT_873331 [Obelidium mucronatum]